MKKTRKLEGQQDWICKMHNKPVQHAVRQKVDEKTGRNKYAGEFFRCPHYHECGYYVSPGTGTVPIVDECGVAIGRSDDEKGAA